MRKLLAAAAFSGLALALCVPSAPAFAQASRTWVSGTGDDVNPCSRTAPCKTFAGAISKTAPGGEIDALDPAGYGAVTITKAITIDGGGGQVASVLVAGTNGIVVQAGASDVIILRNLRINGISGSGNGGINGIRFLAGAALIVEKVDIFGFTTNGIDLEPANTAKAFISETYVQNCGPTAGSAGIFAKPSAGTQLNLVVDRVNVQDCANGFIADGTTGSIAANVRFSNMSGNAGFGIRATSTASAASVVVDSSVAANNGTGLNANGAQAFLRVGGSSITGNATGVSNTGGTLQSFKDNRIVGNGADGTPIPAVNSGGLILN